MKTVAQFESLIAEYFGAKYAVATDCCTHAIELSLRATRPQGLVLCPTHTYISIPFTFSKLNLDWDFCVDHWRDFYYIGNTPIIDAAVLWQENSYISGSIMCLSFQFKKHLSLGRGGMILLDDRTLAHTLKRMSYDGRDLSEPWAKQNITTIGYHYYMTPETAQLGIDKFSAACQTTPRRWSWNDYPDISTMGVFHAK